MKLKDVIPNPDNPRLIKDENYQKLYNSITQSPTFMKLNPLKLDENFMILGGNMRYKICKELGWLEVPTVIFTQKDAEENNKARKGQNIEEATYLEQCREFIIKDNVSYGYNDWDILKSDWKAESENDKFNEWAVDDFPFEDVTVLEAEEDKYEEPNNLKVDVVLGDLIEIGEHRLLCGDSTDSDQVAKLMNGEKAEISFTSPPYNAGTTPTEVKMGKTSKYANDNDNKSENEYLKLLNDFTNNTLLFSEYSFVNIQSLSGNKTALIDFLYEMKSFYADTIIWQKQTSQPAMAENVLNSQYEYIHCFSQKANRAIGTKKFRGTISNVLEISKQTKNKIKEHNATFPIDLAEFVVSNFCENSVLDVFLGSGTTMVAAHQLKRKCYGMELDPKYCQVIIDRMIKLDESLEVKINGERYEQN